MVYRPAAEMPKVNRAGSRRSCPCTWKEGGRERERGRGGGGGGGEERERNAEDREGKEGEGEDEEREREAGGALSHSNAEGCHRHWLET